MSSLDEAQKCFDLLMLASFECVLKGTESPEMAIKVKDDLMHAYQSSIISVNNMVGINVSEADQKEESLRLKREYQSARERTLLLEDKLNSLLSTLDSQLEEVRITFVHILPFGLFCNI